MRNGIARKVEEFRRPCLDGPCQFGEIPDPMHEKRIYKKKVLKILRDSTLHSNRRK